MDPDRIERETADDNEDAGITNINTDEDPWVIRTDFSDDTKWDEVRANIAAPQEQSFVAYVQYVNEDERFAGMSPHSVVRALPNAYPGYQCYIVDTKTISDNERPVLVVDFSPRFGDDDAEDSCIDERPPKEVPLSDVRTMYALPSTIQAIQNNLSLSNMDFEDFFDAVDACGIFRGFPDEA